MFTHSNWSELLGYTSIACWLGAQFPQVLENLRRKSCEGLALPFLANWLLGDLSNLIGCILTHQLPFQTYLATYFVFVDLTLVIQYWYYTRNPSHPPLTHHARRTTDRGTSRYRTLSAVAANVAAAAALAASSEQDGNNQGAYSHSQKTRQLSVDRFRDASSGDLLSRSALRSAGSVDEFEESYAAALADSFHSEGGRDIGRNRYGKRGGSVGPTRYPIPSAMYVTSTESLAEGGVVGGTRGRSLGRDGESASRGRRNSRASIQGATMVFLGVWAMFGISMLRPGSQNHERRIGRVISARDLRIPGDIPGSTVVSEHQQPPPPVEIHFNETLYTSSQFDGQTMEPPSNQRILGRIFAWLCTTLYLTSRLPQIWKNYTRKSVEGLSMYLFVFAFLGNVFYVASILSSPEASKPAPISTNFIRESIPYLLGSAGTLMFDITIVSQSFIYRPRPHGRRHTLRNRLAVEEETGLLSGDSLARPPPHRTVIGEGGASVSRGRATVAPQHS